MVVAVQYIVLIWLGGMRLTYWLFLPLQFVLMFLCYTRPDRQGELSDAMRESIVERSSEADEIGSSALPADSLKR